LPRKTKGWKVDFSMKDVLREKAKFTDSQIMAALKRVEGGFYMMTKPLAPLALKPESDD
jgi:hypothetical protein